ncbi:tRNA (adenosine(37)-N6)-threonylcarbamoyltransferase complex ATPase subunit type 1 TsaE [Amphiplicatus metriothermophilus]|uniref:tRNA threonylcarbamoyladenosine biosynthesis protein TsaE n=1 Tax=Amphiplicatus metriothermophilus TaxID=1519374 RepID=A0A239PK34_9PROT|nr:tRNA (adenosine(37)-N6)-threonylcarbamoyltransferase complex ATPase subunit type 1 TsaE [Amphiplicatus metriothermophilus]MBB5517493.1 tRNA threonylcarbamoyladenosine biosynthesis protein TsaE [Amphiplicatus metriothermophilus]SNT68172.1 tRNA threonylcarbamoyladenosine biosynthesis protein TsaE [Amphiplicatus metriothermophilus]
MDDGLFLPHEAATAALGARLAPLARAGDAIGLSGPLGAGKTTLARGLIGALTGARETPSPTFALVEPYEVRPGAPDGFTLWHFDLYRLEKAEDVWELGWEEALETGAALIEWPERVAALLPARALVLRLEPEGAGRRVRFAGGGDWPDRLARAGVAA